MTEITSETEPEPIKEKIKAISLLSGGLDSAVATKLMQEQGIELIALNFHSPFCTCASNTKYNGCSAMYFAQKMNIPIKFLIKGDDYLEIVKQPQFGYGKNMNPCIDCRIYIFKRAFEYMTEIGAKFIVTGEVLGQRPKSQMLKAMRIIDEASGCAGYVVRPLSAKLLPITIPEKEGWIDRSKLLNIQGRRRNIQLELGRNFGIIKQYCAGGGCLLTDSNFAEKVRDYFQYTPKISMEDMKFLKIGRHFRYIGIKIIGGRNETENNTLDSWIHNRDYLISMVNAKGPNTLIRMAETDLNNPLDLQILNQIIDFAAQVTILYSDSEEQDNLLIIKGPSETSEERNIQKDPTFDPNPYRVGGN
jgi:tRNA U34 2-thiouridine synthase MnmA/TrmU